MFESMWGILDVGFYCMVFDNMVMIVSMSLCFVRDLGSIWFNITIVVDVGCSLATIRA